MNRDLMDLCPQLLEERIAGLEAALQQAQQQNRVLLNRVLRAENRVRRAENDLSDLRWQTNP